MKSKNKIIVSQEKEVFLYDTRLLKKGWSVEIKHKIGGIARFDNLVLISSYNWWGKVFSKFINFSSGETVLDIEENNAPLMFAKVSIKETGAETLSDEKGNFKFENLAEGTYTLVSSFVGYETKAYETKITPNTLPI